MVATAVAVAALCAPAASSAATVSGPVVSGSVSNTTSLGGATAVAVSGHYAFVAAAHDGELTSVDFSNPASPVIPVPGTTGPTNSLTNASNVAILGNYAYVTSKNRNDPTGTMNDDGSGNSLTVVDISSPTSPVVKGFLPDTNATFGAYGIALAPSGGHLYAYVAAQGLLQGQPTGPLTSTGAVDVVDVTDPLHPAIVTTIFNKALPGQWAGTNALEHVTSVAISGHYAFVTASYDNRLTVIDISNPSSPSIVASLQDNTDLNFDVDVAIQGNYAYVADQGAGRNNLFPGLTVVDISNPLAPRVVGANGSGYLNSSYRVKVQRNMAYLATFRAQNAVAVDIANPTAPHVAGGLNDPVHFNQTTGVDVDPTLTHMVLTSPDQPTDLAGMATGTLSVVTLDPNQPIQIGLYGKPSNPTTSTSATFKYYATDTVSDIACALDGKPLAQCDPSTEQYSGLAVGNHTFVLQATDAAGNPANKTYTWTITAPVANVSAPQISGSDRQGSGLSASPGVWTGYPAPALSYQWEDCHVGGGGCTPVAGATKSHYTLTSADVGDTVRVAVTANNSTGSKVATSAATPIVVPSVSTQKLRQALAGQLKPHGKLAKLAALLKKGGYRFTFSALEPGVLTLSWYYVPAGSRLVISHGKVVLKAGKHGRPKPILVATVRVTLRSAGKRALTIKLTSAGKGLLKGRSKVKLTGAGGFTIRSGSPFAVLKPFTLLR